MAIESLQIDIIDTQENGRALILENTEVSSPRLIYNGFEDRFGGIMSSEMQFNMLVKNSEIAKFIHLFTGSETRYRVELLDVSDTNNSVVLWSGFLLPEQFSEPYEKASFFIDFVATDGIGRLKGKALKNKYYLRRIPVLELLYECLCATGLVFPMLFAPAIVSKYAKVTFDELLIDTSVYVDEGERTNAYEILEKIVASLAVTLFQYKKQWFVVGLNRLDALEIDFFKYGKDSLGTFFKNANVFRYRRTQISGRFEYAPVITMVPPVEEYSVVWDADNSKDLLPEDVVTSYPLNYDQDLNDRTVKYWTSEDVANLSVFMNYDDVTTALLYGPFVSVLGWSENVNDVSKRIKLKEPVYIEGSANDEVRASLAIDFIEGGSYFYDEAICLDCVGTELVLWNGDSWWDRIIGQQTFNIPVSLIKAIELGVFQKNFRWALVKENYVGGEFHSSDVVYSSYEGEGIGVGSGYNFELTVEHGMVKGSLDIDNLLIRESGYYNVWLFPMVKNEFLDDQNAFFKGNMIFKKVELKLNSKSSQKVVFKRGIDYTTKLKKTVFHSAALSFQSERRFKFQEGFSKITAKDVQDEFFANKWCSFSYLRFQNIVYSSYLKSVSSVYKELSYESYFSLRGVFLGLMFPLDVLSFKYKNLSRYRAANMVLDLSEGISEVALVEMRNLNNDYFIPDVVPVIEISASSFRESDVWRIVVDYEVFDLPIVDAIVYAKHLSGNPIDGGVVTGYELEGYVNDFKGSLFLDMSYPVPIERTGWYEVRMFQDSVFSNIVYVEVVDIPRIFLLDKYPVMEFTERARDVIYVKPEYSNHTVVNPFFRIKLYTFWDYEVISERIVLLSDMVPDADGYYRFEAGEGLQSVGVSVEDNGVVSNEELASNKFVI